MTSWNFKYIGMSKIKTTFRRSHHFPNHEIQYILISKPWNALINHGNQITQPRSKRHTQKSHHVIIVPFSKENCGVHNTSTTSWCMMRLALSSWSGSILARFKSRRSQSLFHSSSAQLVPWNHFEISWLVVEPPIQKYAPAKLDDFPKLSGGENLKKKMKQTTHLVPTKYIRFVSLGSQEGFKPLVVLMRDSGEGGVFSKNRGFSPKMDGENHGNTLFLNGWFFWGENPPSPGVFCWREWVFFATASITTGASVPLSRPNPSQRSYAEDVAPELRGKHPQWGLLHNWESVVLEKLGSTNKFLSQPKPTWFFKPLIIQKIMSTVVCKIKAFFSETKKDRNQLRRHQVSLFTSKHAYCWRSQLPNFLYPHQLRSSSRD